MKKALIVSSEFPPLPGGIGNHAYNLALNLAQNGFDVQVSTNSREKEAEKKLRQDLPLNLKVDFLTRSRITLITYLKRFFSYFKATKDLEPADSVIVTGKFSVWILGIMPTPKPKHIISVIHGTEIRQSGYWKSIFEKGLSKSSEIVCVSNYTRNKLLEAYQIEPIKVKVINNGFNETVFSKDHTARKAPTSPIKLITVGNIHQRKGQHNVVRSLPSLIKRFGQVEYHLIGIPTEQDRIKKIAESMNVADSIFIHGTCSDESLQDLLSESTIFLMLSEETSTGDFEGFGIAILEANALGVPAIGSVSSGIADAIESGVNGELVNPKSDVEIINAVEKILTHYAAYSEKAIERTKNFAWEKVVKEYIQLM